MVLAAATWAVITYSCMNLIPRMDARWTQFALLTLSNVGGITIQYAKSLPALDFHTIDRSTDVKTKACSMSGGWCTTPGRRSLGGYTVRECSPVIFEALGYHSNIMITSIMVMAVNLGGLSGGQVLREDDAPLYINGFRTMSCVMGGCWISVVILSLDYFLEERRERQQAEVQETA